MIRSPISSEERLRNRVEALETRVKGLEDALMKSFTVLYRLISFTGHGLVETRNIVDGLDEAVETIWQALI